MSVSANIRVPIIRLNWVPIIRCVSPYNQPPVIFKILFIFLQKHYHFLFSITLANPIESGGMGQIILKLKKPFLSLKAFFKIGPPIRYNCRKISDFPRKVPL